MSVEYDNYIAEHIKYVVKAYDFLLKYLPDLLENKQEISPSIYDHDFSKRSKEEYSAYDEYFYGSEEKTPKMLQDFNYAWLHHIHDNPHHWQYWVLINDEDDIVALDMPFEYIIEMICDWWSFSWKSGNINEIFDWYYSHKEHIILSKNTRDKVEYILQRLAFEINNLKNEEQKEDINE